MPLIHAIVLGILQGLTEFLPVSSSAHLELARWLFGWEHFGGGAAREQAFDVAVHLGTLVGALVFLWGDVVRYGGAAIREVCKLIVSPVRSNERNGDASGGGTRDDGMRNSGTHGGVRSGTGGHRQLSSDARVGVALALSTIPAAVVGLALDSTLVAIGEQIPVIAAALFVFGWLFWWADRTARHRTEQSGGRASDQHLGEHQTHPTKHQTHPTERQTASLNVRTAVLMGVAQACALVPGVSRSGASIAAGRLLRFDFVSAARISFLMSLPVIAGAGALRGLGLLGDDVGSGDLAAMGAGMVAAAATAWLALWLILRPLSTRANSGGRLFTGAAIYRTALAVLVAIVLVAGWR